MLDAVGQVDNPLLKLVFDFSVEVKFEFAGKLIQPVGNGGLFAENPHKRTPQHGWKGQACRQFIADSFCDAVVAVQQVLDQDTRLVNGFGLLLVEGLPDILPESRIGLVLGLPGIQVGANAAKDISAGI